MKVRGARSGSASMSVRDEVEAWVKSIKGATCYPSRMKIYAPTCYGKCMPEVEKLISNVNRLFGGSTVYNAEGTWVSDSEVETEPVKVIEVGHHCADPERARELGKALGDYAVKAKQEAISIMSGSFYIARSKDLVETYKKLSEKLP